MYVICNDSDSDLKRVPRATDFQVGLQVRELRYVTLYVGEFL